MFVFIFLNIFLCIENSMLFVFLLSAKKKQVFDMPLREPFKLSYVGMINSLERVLSCFVHPNNNNNKKTLQD